MSRIPYIVIGTALGITLLFAMDMVLNRGNAAAQHVHHSFPECSGSCHG
jgi:hypothetical protein